MRKAAVLMAIVMLSSVLAGCTGGSSDTEKDEQIASLESELANATAQADDSVAHAAALEVTLSEALAALDESNSNIADLSIRLDSAEWHKANLTNQLSNTIEQLNQTQDTGLMAQLEGQIANLSAQIGEADSHIAELSSELAQKQQEIVELDATVTALQSTMSSLTYSTRDRVESCPEDSPGTEILVGYDDGSGAASPDDGRIEFDEIEYTIGECPGNHSMVQSFQNNSDGYGPALMVEMGGILYFAADDGIHGWEPWRSDGTVAGTYMVKDVREEYCYSDGTGGENCINQGSLIVNCWNANLHNNCFYPEMVAGNEKIFFTGFFTWGDGFQSSTTLFISDGTESGTEIAHFHWDSWDPTYSSDQGWGEDVAGVNQLIAIPSSGLVSDRVVYTALEVFGGSCEGCHPPDGRELWISDGTPSGTYMLANIQPEDEEWDYQGTTYCCADFQGGEPRHLLKKGNTIWFSANTTEYGRELYRYSLGLGGGLFLVSDIQSGSESSNPMYMTSGSDGVYFSADYGTSGRELYHSRGDAFTTGIVKDINPGNNGSNPQFFTKFGTKVFFTANDGENGHELWISDRTESGTFMVKDINPNGSGDPYQLKVLDGVLYFTAYEEEHGRELWRSDGTPSGTYMVKDLNPGNNSSWYFTEFYVTGSIFSIHQGELFFACDDGTHGVEICRSDGSLSGTQLAVDSNPGENSSWPFWFTSVGSKLYFQGITSDHGRQLQFIWDNPGPIIASTDSS